MAIRRIQFYISQLETNFNYLIKSRITANACTGLSVADPVPRTASFCQFANSTEDFAMKLVNNPIFFIKNHNQVQNFVGSRKLDCLFEEASLF